MIQFNNTEIAFKSKSKKELLHAKYLFKSIEKPWLVKFGSLMLVVAIFFKIPIKWILRPVFNHFCGGETIFECESTILALGKNEIGSILDYSAEGNNKESDFEIVMLELLKVIESSKTNKNIPFAVFKLTGIARFALLEKLNSSQELNSEEMLEFEKLKLRIDNICNAAFQAELPVFIDAEERWIQNAIDMLVVQMMQKYNKQKAIVFNTLQMYRHDRIDFLKMNIEQAKAQQYFIGLKLVRGAYMEKERERAKNMGYLSPIHINKEYTDKDYDKALEICVAENNLISFCAGSHNEESNALLVSLISEKNIEKNDKNIYFAQLLGMSDHISYNLAHNGYNVAKYVPYGPLKSVMPYLIRRAQENTSIAGQTGRELNLIKDELKRRNYSEI